MQVLDRTKRHVQPFRLALATQRRPSATSYNPYVSGLRGLGSLWDDILEAGGNWLDNKLNSAGVGGSDVVGIQNQVGQTMDQLSAQYYPLRDAHQVTADLIGRFQTAMQTIINSFCNRMRSIGTSRALNGCTTIQYWGGKWIQDREAEKAALVATGVPVGQNTVIDPVTGLPIIFQNPPGVLSSASSYMPILLGAVFIYAMITASKHK